MVLVVFLGFCSYVSGPSGAECHLSAAHTHSQFSGNDKAANSTWPQHHRAPESTHCTGLYVLCIETPVCVHFYLHTCLFCTPVSRTHAGKHVKSIHEDIRLGSLINYPFVITHWCLYADGCECVVPFV